MAKNHESVVSPSQGYPTGPNPTSGTDNPLGFTLLTGLALTQLRRRAKQAD